MITKHFVHICVNYTIYLAIFFFFCTEKVYLEVAKCQRQRYEMAQARPVKRATEGMDYALVSIYTFLPLPDAPKFEQWSKLTRPLKHPFNIKQAEEFDGCWLF